MKTIQQQPVPRTQAAKHALCALALGLICGGAMAVPITDPSGFGPGDAMLDFGEVALASGTLVDNQFAAYGVTFTGGIYVGNGAYSSGDHVSGTYLDSFSGGGHTNLWTIDFSQIQTAAGAYFEIDFDNNLILTALLAGSTVETASFSDGLCCSTMQFAGFSGISFDSIRIETSLSQGRNFYMDELHYSTASSVPEPGTLALLGISLAGLALARKKNPA